MPPGFDGSPMPIAGTWKEPDGSLSSIGNVESAFWGAGPPARAQCTAEALLDDKIDHPAHS